MSGSRCNLNQLWTEYLASGTDEARNRLVERYLPIVDRECCVLSSRLPPQRAYDRDDIYQWGCLGLIRAVRGYDPSSGPFEPWAKVRVLGSMLDGIRNWSADLETEQDLISLDAMEEDDDDEVADGALSEDVPPDQQASIDEFWSHVTRGLSRRNRKILLWHFRHEISSRTIANMQDVSHSGVAWVLRRCIQRIRKHHEKGYKSLCHPN